MGPTAVGKTEVAIPLAKHFSAEILSADSRQFYREMRIGTARPADAELKEVRHHFVGHLSIRDEYNAARYEEEVLSFLGDYFTRRNIALLVGGSGLYIDAVCNGIDELPDPDPEIRERLKSDYKILGIDHLRQQLSKMDPDYYQQVDLSNPTRLMRALEVCIMTGRPYSTLRKSVPKERGFNIIRIGLERPREELNKRIDDRVDRMIEEGLVEEARSLYAYRSFNALNTVGYKELFSHFDGLGSIEDATGKIKTNTRRYAKRQMTWFRRDPGIRWFHPEELKDLTEYAALEIVS